jgi:hypothetical protein
VPSSLVLKSRFPDEHSEKSEVDAAVEEPSVEPDSRTVIFFELLNRRRVLTGPQTRQMKGIGRIE